MDSFSGLLVTYRKYLEILFRDVHWYLCTLRWTEKSGSDGVDLIGERSGVFGGGWYDFLSLLVVFGSALSHFLESETAILMDLSSLLTVVFQASISAAAFPVPKTPHSSRSLYCRHPGHSGHPGHPEHPVGLSNQWRSLNLCWKVYNTDRMLGIFRLEIGIRRDDFWGSRLWHFAG